MTCNLLHNLPVRKRAVCEALGRKFSASGERIFLVGGAVRALHVGETADIDLDFTTSASPETIRRLCNSLAKAVYDKSGIKGYGTQGVIFADGEEVEVTPLRKVPGIEAPDGTALTADLLARDFTVGAVAVDVSPDGWGRVADPAGGLADLDAKILRCPSDPRLILGDDPLRALRAVRLAVKYSLEIEPFTRDGIADFTRGRPELIAGIAGERVREELFKMLAGPAPSKAVTLMEELGLLAILLPEIPALRDIAPEAGFHHKDIFEHTLGVLDRAAAHNPPGVEKRIFMLAALLHDAGKPAVRKLEGGDYSFIDHEKEGAAAAEGIAARLRLSGDETKTLKTLILKHHRLHQYTPEWTDAAVRRALHDLGDLYGAVLALSIADATGQDPERRAAREENLQNFLERVDALDREQVIRPRLPLDGNEVMALLGLNPAERGGGGRAVGRALAALREKVISGEIAPDDAEAARRFVAGGEWEE